MRQNYQSNLPNLHIVNNADGKSIVVINDLDLKNFIMMFAYL